MIHKGETEITSALCASSILIYSAFYNEIEMSTMVYMATCQARHYNIIDDIFEKLVLKK